MARCVQRCGLMAFYVGVKYAYSLNSASRRKGSDSPAFEYVMSSWTFSNEYDKAEWGMIWRLALKSGLFLFSEESELSCGDITGVASWEVLMVRPGGMLLTEYMRHPVGSLGANHSGSQPSARDLRWLQPLPVSYYPTVIMWQILSQQCLARAPLNSLLCAMMPACY